MTASLTLSVPSQNGSQRPSYQHVPAAFASYGDQAVSFCRHIGLTLDDWQEYVLRTLFSVDRNLHWQLQEFGLLVSRQNGKGELLVAITLVHLFLVPRLLKITEPRRRTILYSAHLYSTALDGFGRIIAVIRSKPELMKQVAHIYEGRGSESIVLTPREGQLQGDLLKVTARSKNASRGIPSVDVIVADEAQELGLAAWNALSYTQSQVAAPMAIFTGTAPEDGVHDSEVFEGIRDRGRAGTESRLGWMEWSPPGSHDPEYAAALLADAELLADPAVWIASVPSAGIRMGWDTVLREYNSAVGNRDLEGFARERLSLWANRPEVVNETDELNELDLEAWYETGVEGADPQTFVTGDQQVIAVALGPGGGYASVAVAARHDDDSFNVAHLRTAAGIAWLVPYLKEIKAERGDALIVMDKGNAAPILNALEVAKIKPIFLDATEVAGAYGNFVQVVNTHGAWHPDQSSVTTSLEFSTTRSVGRYGLTFAQSKPEEPITHAMAVAWSLYGVTKAEAMDSRKKPPAKIKAFYT